MNKLSVAAAFAAMSFAVPAMAATADAGLNRIVVSTTGLDLASAEGERALDLRILHAASSVCETPSAADAQGWKRFKACRETATASANAQRRSAGRLASVR